MLVDVLDLKHIEKEYPFNFTNALENLLNKLVELRKEEGYKLLQQSMNKNCIVLTWEYKQ